VKKRIRSKDPIFQDYCLVNIIEKDVFEIKGMSKKCYIDGIQYK
jgi:hypothetical protein